MTLTIELYVHNTGRVLAHNIVVELTYPEGCTVNTIQNGLNDGWKPVNYAVGVPRPPRFEGDMLNHADFAFIGSLSVIFPKPPQVSANITHELAWKILAAELPEPVAGKLSCLPVWR